MEDKASWIFGRIVIFSVWYEWKILLLHYVQLMCVHIYCGSFSFWHFHSTPIKKWGNQYDKQSNFQDKQHGLELHQKNLNKFVSHHNKHHLWWHDPYSWGCLDKCLWPSNSKKHNRILELLGPSLNFLKTMEHLISHISFQWGNQQSKTLQVWLLRD